MNSLQDLEHRHPEWTPWLAVVGEALGEARNAEWDRTVPPGVAPRASRVPLLANAALRPDGPPLRRLLGNLMRSAGRSGARQLACLQAITEAQVEAADLFHTALNHDHDRMQQAACAAGIDPAALQAVAALLPIPFLQACNRRWAQSIPEGWLEGYCPVCGAWPAFAEMRGVERRRYLRCGSCGTAWQAPCLFCPYCGMTDHDVLASLVAEQSESKQAIDVCKRCLGYLKVFTTLRGSPPADVILEDLASAELDIAALARGYRRPPGPGCALEVQVAEGAQS